MKIKYILLFCIGLLFSCEQQVNKSSNKEIGVYMSERNYDNKISLTINFIDTIYKLRYTHFKKPNFKNKAGNMNYTNTNSSIELIKNNLIVDLLTFQGVLNYKHKAIVLEKGFKKSIPSISKKDAEIGVIRLEGENNLSSKIVVGRVGDSLIHKIILPNIKNGYGKNKGESYKFNYGFKQNDTVFKIFNQKFLKENDSLISENINEYEIFQRQFSKKLYFPKTDTLFTYKFKKDSTYSYYIINKRKTRIDYNLFAILTKNKRLVDSHILNDGYFDYIKYSHYIQTRKNIHTDVAIDNIDELAIYTDEYGKEDCEFYEYTDVLFGKSGDKLIKELYASSKGGLNDVETGSWWEANKKIIIPNSKSDFNNYLIVNDFFSIQDSGENANKVEGTNIYRFVEKYRFNKNQFIVESNNYEDYVTSNEGLIIVSNPINLEPLDTLNYLDPFKVIAKSEKENMLKNIGGVFKKSKGFWHKIYYPKSKDSIGYIIK